MTWRVAESLDVLLAQWNAAHPGRLVASDGSIGDAAHATRESDHNPWVGPAADGKMIVTARDFTHDPAHGADADALAEALKQRKDPRVKYVIRARRIWSLARDSEGWRPYAGPNPHLKHVHVSVSPLERLYDSTAHWNLTLPGSPGSTPGKDTEVTEAQAAQLLDLLGKLLTETKSMNDRVSVLSNFMAPNVDRIADKYCGPN